MTRPALTVTLSADASTLTMAKGTWSHTIPTDDLPAWIKLYEELRDREKGKFAQFFEADVAALEQAQRDIKRRMMT